MPTWGWVVLAIAVVAVVVMAILLVSANRRTAALRGRFGSEYDRTVEATGGKRDAEAELQERAKRREQFDVRPLTRASRDRYLQDWRSVQTQFVDDPAGAVGGADSLIRSVMHERGYPVEDFDQRADDLSVDHPQVVENYREGHRLAMARNRSEETRTEDLRQAMRHYRSLFEELVEPVGSAEPAGSANGLNEPTDSNLENRRVQ